MATDKRPKDDCNLTKNAKQPKGNPTGAGDIKAEHMTAQTGPVVRATSKPLTSTGSFTISAAKGADGFGYSGGQKKGIFRMSGHPGAHMVGAKKK
jgi:hypothetical protein